MLTAKDRRQILNLQKLRSFDDLTELASAWLEQHPRIKSNVLGPNQNPAFLAEILNFAQSTIKPTQASCRDSQPG